MTPTYEAFLARRAVSAAPRGMEDPPTPPDHLYRFQGDCGRFGLHQGSWSCWLGTGLGKTRIELWWADVASRQANAPGLILTPLAVARQIEAEGKSLGYDVRVIRTQDDARPGLNVCNYDRLDALDPQAFGAVALDESSILKDFTGKTSRAIINAFAGHRWRMSATATPAPNDHVEIAQHSDFCGVMDRAEMLVRWFLNDTSDTGEWRLKGHAVKPFWDWVATWARAASHPRELGDDVAGYDLKPFRVVRHEVEAEVSMEGTLFGPATVSATDMHRVKRQTSGARADAVVELVYNASVWEPNTTSAPTCGPGSSVTATTYASTGSYTPKKETRDAGNATQPIPSSARNSRPRRATIPQRNAGQSDGSAISGSADSPSNSTMPGLPSSAGDAEYANEQASGSGPIIATRRERPEDSSVIVATSALDSLMTAKRHCAEPWLIWCDTDYEQDALEAAFLKKLGKAAFFSVRGSQSADAKEAAIMAWIAGARPIMITKPVMMGYGLNFQHCARMAFAGRTFSFEVFHQAVRRCWRFGQTREVEVHIVTAPGEDHIGRVLDRKADAHDSMKDEMVAAMKRAIGKTQAVKVPYLPKHEGRMPVWL